MLRKLPLALAVSLALAPLHSHALGLGQITARSVLNQPFDAEIQLLSVPPGELDGVRVSLANAQAFNRAGIDRPYMLTKLRFKTIRKANGDAAIEIFSRDSIQEPYLNFLVEVNWPNGRMLREYTVLLDPPLATGRRAAAVTTPAVAAPSVSAPSASAPAQVTRSAVSRQPETVSRVSASGEYGPVQRNETLWTIADNTRPAGASVNQMMLAILKANPQAFASDNVNTLKAGSILRIPADEAVFSLTAEQARQIANQQYREWKQGMAVPATPELSSQPEPQPAPEPAPQPQAAATAAAVSEEEQARLKLSGSDVAGESGAGTTSEEVRQQLLAAQEAAVSSQEESDELRMRLEEMQAQLLDMKRLLELKDAQLSQLQAANSESLPGVQDPLAEEGMPEVSEPESSEPETLIIEDEPQVADSEELLLEPEPEVVEEETVEELVVEQQPAATETAPAMVEEEAVIESTQPPAEKSLLQLITGSATMMGIAVAILVVLIALIWAAFSRRKPADESQPAGKVADDISGDTEDLAATAAPASGELQADAESSFLSEFTPADLDELDRQETGEVDPISEADVYIAYGRFDEAEKLVQQALDQDHGNVAYQHKLLEIYYTNKDTGKFTALMQEMASSDAEEADASAWNRAKLMGSELDPENPLFADAIDAPSQDVTDDLDLALSELESQLTDDMDGSAPDLNAPSEDLEELDLGEIAGKPADDELPELETPQVSDAGQDDSVRLDALDELDDSSFAADFTDTAPKADDDAIEQLAAELESFDVNTLDDEQPLSAEQPQTPAELDAVHQQPVDDLESTADDLLLADEFDDLSDDIGGDEISTKIDLARAYIEMGDKEGARGILEEVVEEGSEAQQQEARNLIAEIS